MLADIAAAVVAPPGAVAVEVGPGTGQLTEFLLERGHTVVAIEVEDRMVAHLKKRFAGNDRLRVVQDDARSVDLEALLGPEQPFVAVGNLPYFAASPIIRRFVEHPPRPLQAVFMVQKEVAREICATDGHFSLLTIGIRVFAEAELLFDVRPEAFDPPPKVMSSVIRLDVRPEPLVPPERDEAFFDLVSRTFRNPRKQVHNALTRGMSLPPEATQAALARAGIDPTRRPETLSISEWLALLDAVEALHG